MTKEETYRLLAYDQAARRKPWVKVISKACAKRHKFNAKKLLRHDKKPFVISLDAAPWVV